MGLVRSRYAKQTLRQEARRPLVWGSWALFVAAAELLGRRSPDELHDALGVLGLCAVIAFNLWLYLRGQHPWSQACESAAARVWLRLKRCFPVVGVDLRETPAIRAGIPPVFFWVLAAGWSVVAVRLLVGAHAWTELRTALLSASPTVLFVVEAVIWSTVLAGALFCLGAVALGLFLFLQRTRLPQRADFQRAFLLGTALYTVVVLGLGLLVQSSLPMQIVAGLLLVTLALTVLPWHPSVLLLWRPRGPEFRLRVVEMRFWNHLCEWCAVGVFLALALPLSSASLPAGVAQQTIVSGTLSMILGWAALGFAPVWLWFALLSHMSSWLRNPARPCPTRLQIVGVADRRRRRALRRTLRNAGFRLRFAPSRPREGSLVLRLGSAASEAHASAARSSLCFSWEDLAESETLERIRLRDVVQRRRQFRKGLRKAFYAAKGRYAKGSGFLVAPHLWFAEGLGRDEDDDDHLDTCVGPRFHRVMPLTARHHFHQVMRALGIDLVFLEDGIRWKQFQGVLRTMYEIYDIHGGEQEARGRHFIGIPGVRVILHDLAPTEPWLHSGYPEPEFEDVARARVLHVFRDRGDADDSLTPSWDFDFVPDVPDTVLS